MTDQEKRHPADCLSDAEDAVQELRKALHRSGIVLPSLRVETDSYARAVPCPLIELGRSTVDVVRRLTAALRKDESAGTP
ncbi:hypothetical protein GCM10010232_10850 [Streptomyces amakusaensis]|uniref:Uncharacterized protein n=1 Tax=Streptomyces amakusaensis TaxID=67271 RepID=A0ABW0AFR0_9ACTN